MHKIELMTENNAPWEDVWWTKPCPPPKYSVITDNRNPIPDMPSLFNTMHAHFSSAANATSISNAFLDSLLQLPMQDWPAISQQEVVDMLKLTSNASVPGPDSVTWHHIKQIFNMEGVSDAILTLFNNICDSSIWPSWFKESTSVIIPKPKTSDYTVPKSYRPIVLLNTLGKPLTKVMANHLQFDAAAYSLLHEGQCGRVQKHATIDASIILLDFINANRECGWHMSACTINVAQFFPSLNHGVIAHVLAKLGFTKKLTNLITSYFAGRKTSYWWDTAMSELYDFSLGTLQGNCLSPIISALFLNITIKHVFPHSTPPKAMRCLFFVDDGALCTASLSLTTNVQVLSQHLCISSHLLLTSVSISNPPKLSLYIFLHFNSAGLWGIQIRDIIM